MSDKEKKGVKQWNDPSPFFCLFPSFVVAAEKNSWKKRRIKLRENFPSNTIPFHFNSYIKNIFLEISREEKERKREVKEERRGRSIFR